MGVELNATLLVQMVHFFIAYVLVDRIIMRLATAVVTAEDRKLEALEADGAEAQQRVTSRIRYNEDDWLILQKRLQAECPTPHLGKHYAAEYDAHVPVAAPSHELIDDLTTTCTTLFVRHVTEQHHDR